MKSFLTSVAVLLSISTFALPLHAQASVESAPNNTALEQSARVQPVSGAYERLASVLSPAEMEAVSFDIVIEQLRENYAKNEDFQALETVCPGSIDAVLQGGDELLRTYHAAEGKALRAALGEYFRANLSEEHANLAADFYGSVDGQKIIRSINENFTLSESLTDLSDKLETTDDPDAVQLDAQSFRRDEKETVKKATQSLTALERVEITRTLLGKEWFRAVQNISPGMNEVRFRVANSELIPGFQPRLNTAFENALAVHLENCDL